jgi:hypothetical protein
LHELRIERLASDQTMEGRLRAIRDRLAEGTLIHAWRDAGSADVLVSLGEKAPGLSTDQEAPPPPVPEVVSVEAIELAPCDASELVRGPRDRGFHELRHYRLAAGTTPRMLALFEDVRRLMPEHEVRVLAWWTARYQGTERFVWLREFKDAAHKARIMKDLYESERWLRDFKPRTVGMIEERLLRDLLPLREVDRRRDRPSP